MMRNSYEFGTSPRKIKPDYRPNQNKQKDIKKIKKINQNQIKQAIKLEKKKNNKNVIQIIAVFLILLFISYRSSQINERFNEMQSKKANLSAIEKTNGQLEVSIESSLNLDNIEQSAKEKLGMQKLDNDQKVFVNLDKKDYIESGNNEIEVLDESNESWFGKILSFIFLCNNK